MFTQPDIDFLLSLNLYFKENIKFHYHISSEFFLILLLFQLFRRLVITLPEKNFFFNFAGFKPFLKSRIFTKKNPCQLL